MPDYKTEQKDEFVNTLEKYLKHSGLEIVFTLKNGKRVIMNGKKQMEGNEIIQYLGKEKGIILDLNDIKSADVYAL